MKNEIFKINPSLKEVYMTTDGQAFYQEGDAKNHAKTLEDKKVELVMNEEQLTAEDEESVVELTDAEVEVLANVEAATYEALKALVSKLKLEVADTKKVTYQEALTAYKASKDE